MSNEVLENIKSRRSVRTYTEQQVSAGDLNLVLEAAAYAPSGMTSRRGISPPSRMPPC